jgi:predicted ATPase
MVFESIASLLVHRAILRPVLLILDDLHWADPTSVALLALLARRTNGHRLALVATILVEDRQHALDPTLLAVRRLPDAQ